MLSASIVAVAMLSMNPSLLGQGPARGDAESAESFLAHAPTGTLRVRAVQGSDGGTQPAGAPIQVTLYRGESVLRTLTAVLDERGEAMLTGIPVVMGVLPVVQIRHSGVTYQEPGGLMDPQQREMAIEVKVYDTTQDRPAWSVAMRHALVERGSSGVLNVSEMVVVDNRGDRTWTGETPDEKGKACTVRLELPAGARKVRLISGFHGWCCTKFEASELSVWMPLMPGKCTFEFGYEVPVSGDTMEMRFGAGVTTDHLMMFAREEGFAAGSLGSGIMEVEVADQSFGRLLQGKGVEAGDRAGLVLTGLAPAIPDSTAADRALGGPLAWAGLIAVGAGFAGWLVRRRVKRSAVP